MLKVTDLSPLWHKVVYKTSDGSWRTGAFRPVCITVGYAACSVTGVVAIITWPQLKVNVDLTSINVQTYNSFEFAGPMGPESFPVNCIH